MIGVSISRCSVREVEAASIWQTDVKQNQIGPILTRRRHGFRAVLRRRDGIALAFEAILEAASQQLVIFHNQDFGGHVLPVAR